jgi:glycosyltransferase involved in cell wall biosynthesis
VRQAGRRLIVIGDGPMRGELEAGARGAHVEFLGAVSDDELRSRYARCRALIFPQEEDYGLTPLEAQASGRPVIAYAAGGALETIVEGRTGVFFRDQSVGALAEAIRGFERVTFDSREIRTHASRFDVEPFSARMTAFIAESVNRFRAGSGAKGARRSRTRGLPPPAR